MYAEHKSLCGSAEHRLLFVGGPPRGEAFCGCGQVRSQFLIT